METQMKQTSTQHHSKLNIILDNRYISVFGHKFLWDRSSLVPLIKSIPVRNTMVEVGSLAGFSTALFAQYFQQVISVDPYSPGYDSNDLNSNATRLEIARDLFSLRFFDNPNVVQINLPSRDAARQFETASVDFVYIDANHTFEGVLDDIDAWRDKLQPKGVMAGDDIDWIGVKHAVQERFDGWERFASHWRAVTT